MPSKARRRWPRVALAVVVLGALAAGAYLYLNPDRPELADARSVALPKARDREATAAFLRGPGADLLRFHRASRALSAPRVSRDLDACRRIVRRRLAPTGSPRALSRLAARVPDRVARDMFASELRAVVAVVAACRSGEGREQATESLSFQRTVLARRLRQVGPR